MIIFDSTYLVVYLNPNPPAAKDREDKPVERFKERVAHLAATLDVSNQVIGVPAPAMAEVLVRAGKGRAQLVSVLSDRSRFEIVPFDSRAAIEASELIAAVKSNNEKWDTWAKVKFDIQIVAIAKAESASVIYADDKDIENYAKRLKIPVVRICDLPLPLPPPEEKPIEAGAVGTQMNLLITDIQSTPEAKDAAEKGLSVADAGQPETDNKLQADPAHSAPIHGSDSGRAEGETASEEKRQEAKDILMRKWYFYGVDGPNIAWQEDRAKAFKYSSKEAAEGESTTLNSSNHLITPSEGGARLRFRNFRVEQVDPSTFVVCFDVEPESGLSKA